jgi:hypothetical protein
MMITTHTITIDTPPEGIWPWLVQMGWHRGQWYTARWTWAFTLRDLGLRSCCGTRCPTWPFLP